MVRRWLAAGAILAGAAVLVGCGRPRAAEREARLEIPPPVSTRADIDYAKPSPRGDRLLVMTSQRGRQPRRWLVDLRRVQVRELSEPTGMGLGGVPPEWRPDGAALASLSVEFRPGRPDLAKTHLSIYELAAGRTRTVSLGELAQSGAWPRSGPGSNALAWSSDGRRVGLALTFQGNAKGARSGRPPRALYSVSADGSSPPRLEADRLERSGAWSWGPAGSLLYTPEPGAMPRPPDRSSVARRVLPSGAAFFQSLEPAPDGTKVVCSWSESGDAAVAVLGPALTPVLRKTGFPRPPDLLLWSPDSRRVLLRTPRDASERTYLLDVKTGALSQLDDHVLGTREAAGWVHWQGKAQLLFVDERAGRLLITEGATTPFYPLLIVRDDGTLAFDAAQVAPR